MAYEKVTLTRKKYGIKYSQNCTNLQPLTLVVPIQRTPRLLVGRDDLQTLRHSFNDVSSPAWRNKFQDLHIKFDKIPLNV